MLIGGEATGLLWWQLYQTWANDPTLATCHPTFFLLTPALIKHFRGAGSAQDKADPLDARLMACDLGLPDLVSPSWDPALDTWPLRFLTCFRCAVAHQWGALKTYAHTWLYLYASAYEKATPFADPFGKTSVPVLQTYATLDTLAVLPLAGLAAPVDRWGKHHRFNAETQRRRVFLIRHSLFAFCGGQRGFHGCA